MKNDKINLFLLIILIGVFCISMRKEKTTLLIGSWKAIKALNETGVPCDIEFPIKNSCILTFNKDSTYEGTIKKGEESRKDYGKYILIKDSKKMFLKFSETQVYLPDRSHSQSVDNCNYPIIKLTKDTLIIRYNLCCNKDTCDINSGTVIFVKEKKLD